MKYNAEDILHQSFERRFRGYDPDQVREFLQSMAREWDFFFSEVTTLQNTVAEQADELKELRCRERGLLDALSAARELAATMKRQAEERSAAILDQAQTRADKIIDGAERQRHRLERENTELRAQRERLDQDLRAVLETHQRLLDEARPIESTSPSLQAAPQTEQPVIHRRPRTQPPAAPAHPPQAQGEDADREQLDEGSHETLVGVALHGAVS